MSTARICWCHSIRILYPTYKETSIRASAHRLGFENTPEPVNSWRIQTLENWLRKVIQGGSDKIRCERWMGHCCILDGETYWVGLWKRNSWNLWFWMWGTVRNKYRSDMIFDAFHLLHPIKKEYPTKINDFHF